MMKFDVIGNVSKNKNAYSTFTEGNMNGKEIQ